MDNNQIENDNFNFNFDDIIKTLSENKKKESNITNINEQEEYNQEKQHMEKLKYLDPCKEDSDSDSENENEKKLLFSNDNNDNNKSKTKYESDSDLDSDSESNSDSKSESDCDKEDINNNENQENANAENINVDYEIPEQLLNEDIIGIDLGTTNTCVSIWKDGCAEIIPDEFGNKLTPSYVAYTNKSRYIGHDAKKQKDINIKNVFYEVKRLIGRKYDDKYVQRERELLSYDIISDEHKNILLKADIKSENNTNIDSLRTNYKLLTPEEISAAILTKAKQIASNHLKKRITKCVITVPAHFNDGQRQATKDAAKIAGLECIRIINEPTAAALAYGLLERTKNSKNNNRTIMVYDFGGGTLDVSILNIDSGIFTVLGSTGNMRLGGSDFDTCLIEYCIKRFSKSNKDFNLEKLSAVSLQKLRTSCENAKQLLSTVTETHIAVKDFHNGVDLFYKITRQDFENLCRDLFLLCIKPVNDILKMTNISDDKIDEIILVGGMTRIPKIRELLKIKLKKEPNCTINPDEAVAAGAAIQAYILSHPDNPFSESVTLLDATALSLGVETIGGLMNTIIKRGETIPVTGKKIYSTDSDYVKSVKIRVFEGERRLTKDNFCVGEFILNDITPQPRGIPEIEVMFNIDANGIITVTATNKKTNKKSSMLVTSNKGRLNQNQINMLIEESIELEIRDELDKRKKWMHYEIEDMCSSILINIKNKMIKISENDKIIIKDDINKILSWLKEKTYDERDDQEYDDMLQKIKKKYTVLVIKGKYNEDDNVKSLDNTNINATDIYDNNNNDVIREKDALFEELEEEELGFKGLSDPEKEELKELRKSVSNLCYSILDLTSSENINLSKEDIEDLKDYIDDTLLWMHIHDKIKKEEYVDKINEINKNCDRIFEHYKEIGVNIFGENKFEKAIGNKNKKDELENLCYILKIMIEDGAFPLKSKYLQNLQNTIEDTLNFIYDYNKENNEENNKENNNFYEICDKKINYINDLCNELHTKMQGININEQVDIFGNERIIIPEKSETDADDPNQENEEKGISIISIMQRKKQDVMDKMILENNE
jgi:molecular chaperone DnaK (HSP70)